MVPGNGTVTREGRREAPFLLSGLAETAYRRSGPMEQALTLTDAELYDLTHKRRPAAQVRALRFMGIEHQQRPDGTVAVLREHVQEVLSGKRSPKPACRAEINWED